MEISVAKYFLHEDFDHDKAFWRKSFLNPSIMKSDDHQKENPYEH